MTRQESPHTTSKGGVVYLSAAQLAERYGVHQVTIWRWAAKGAFPQPERIGPATTRWRKDEVDAWDAHRAQANA